MEQQSYQFSQGFILNRKTFSYKAVLWEIGWVGRTDGCLAIIHLYLSQRDLRLRRTNFCCNSRQYNLACSCVWVRNLVSSVNDKNALKKPAGMLKVLISIAFTLLIGRLDCDAIGSIHRTLQKPPRAHARVCACVIITRHPIPWRQSWHRVLEGAKFVPAVRSGSYRLCTRSNIDGKGS